MSHTPRASIILYAEGLFCGESEFDSILPRH